MKLITFIVGLILTISGISIVTYFTTDPVMAGLLAGIIGISSGIISFVLFEDT
jgi:hypothetical protein